MCLVSLFFQFTLPDVTAIALLFLTLQRYLQLNRPIATSEKMDVSNSAKLCLLWSLIVLFWLVCLLVFVAKDLFDIAKCDINPSLRFVIAKECLFSLGPCILIIILNARSMAFLYNKKHRILNKKSFNSRQLRIASAPNLKLSGGVKVGSKTNYVNKRMMIRSKSVMNKMKVARRNSKCDDKVRK